MGHHWNILGHTLLLCCLLSLLFLQCSQGKRDNSNNNRAGRPDNKQARANRCKNKRTFTFKASDLKTKPVKLTCAVGPVVSSDIVAVKGKCRGTTGFTRWSAGRCMWNQTCELSFQDKAIDSLLPNVKDKKCLGQLPDKLEVGYTCLKKKVAKEYIENAPRILGCGLSSISMAKVSNKDVMVTDILGSFKKTRRSRGIIRSHKLLPWSYRNGEKLGNVTFIRPRKPAGLTNLWISVYYYAILNRDLVFLSWEEPGDPNHRGQTVRALRQIMANDTTFSLRNVTEVILTFYPDYTHAALLRGEDKGFLLCYQWLKPNAKPKKGSVCTKVMMPAKCRGKRRGGRGRKGGNAGSRNSNRRSRKNQASRSRQTPRNRRPSSKWQQQT